MISCSAATSLLLLLPILAAASLLTAVAAAADDAACPPATCGNLTFTYPFWQTGGTDQSSCGPPAFQLSCDSSSVPAAASLSKSYMKVLAVDYGTRSLVAVHALFVSEDAACKILFNISSAFAITDRFTISQSNRELYVLSCGESRPPPGSVPVTNCSSTNSSGMYAYLGGNYSEGQPPVNDGSCEIVVIPVLGSSEPAEMTAANYRQLIKGGFLLEWEPVGDCDACRASGGLCRYDGSTAMFACLCSGGGLRTSTCDVKHRSNLTLIASLSAGASFAVICLAYLMYRYKRKFRSSSVHRVYLSKTSNLEEMLRKCGSLALKRYKYQELKNITRSFRDELGEGGYGVVYKGTLKDGRTVAVKLLKESRGNGEDFLNEVMSIGQTSHINIVTLLGFCLERSKRALVYEFMPNGSLKNHIYSSEGRSKLLDTNTASRWEVLLKIAIGIARGLEYLHQGCNTRIIHFDIKPNNILLDDDLRPKIADFGLAKLCHVKDSLLSTAAEARGTVGFIAPEVYSRGFGVVSTKSDVYSYGMLLLEMVRGKEENLKVNTVVDGGDDASSSEVFFPHWVHDRLAREMASSSSPGGGGGGWEVVGDGNEEVVARKMTMVGLWCIQMTPETRPSMSRVIEMLERSIGELEMPPKPFMITTPLNSTNVSSSYTSAGVVLSAS